MNEPTHTFSVTPRAQPAVDGDAARRQAYRLGVAGLIPFLVFAALYTAVSGELRQQAGLALVAYGAVIASFLGALHWSAVIDAEKRDAVTARMLFAVTPALLGWLAVLLPLLYGLTLVIATLWLAYYADRRWFDANTWYPVLRKRLTFVATLSLTVAALGALKEI